jgi:uncharacterized protein with PIN domain
MGKKNIMISVDEEILKKAKSRLVNVSAICERALELKSVTPDSQIKNEFINCEFCSREMRKATAEDQNGLTWLCPNEKWICPFCLKSKIRVLI